MRSFYSPPVLLVASIFVVVLSLLSQSSPVTARSVPRNLHLVCEPGCLHNGTCKLNPKTKEPECECQPYDHETGLYFRGKSCQTEAVRCNGTWWCENGGKCVAMGAQGFLCSCPHKFQVRLPLPYIVRESTRTAGYAISDGRPVVPLLVPSQVPDEPSGEKTGGMRKGFSARAHISSRAPSVRRLCGGLQHGALTPVVACSTGLWCANGGMCVFSEEANATICKCPSTHTGASCQTLVEAQDFGPSEQLRTNFTSPLIIPSNSTLDLIVDERDKYFHTFFALLGALVFVWVVSLCFVYHSRERRRSSRAVAVSAPPVAAPPLADGQLTQVPLDNPASQERAAKDQQLHATETSLRTKEEELRRMQEAVQKRVAQQVTRVEQEAKKLEQLRKELDTIEDPTKKEVADLRKRIELVDRELRPMRALVERKEKELKDATTAYNNKNAQKSELVGKLFEIVTESERQRLAKLEEITSLLTQMERKEGGQ
ncbi:unnamed protein product [Closterium sp. NIES-65]|nr:unnamed protein product [Closterium sp. NIES-65]